MASFWQPQGKMQGLIEDDTTFASYWVNWGCLGLNVSRLGKARPPHLSQNSSTNLGLCTQRDEPMKAILLQTTRAPQCQLYSPESGMCTDSLHCSSSLTHSGSGFRCWFIVYSRSSCKPDLSRLALRGGPPPTECHHHEFPWCISTRISYLLNDA